MVVPSGYSVDVLFSAGDPVEAGATGYAGAFQSSAETERQAGGNHDGMHYFALPGVDPQKGGLLAINHELPDYNILFRRLQCRHREPGAEAHRPVGGGHFGDRSGTGRQRQVAGQARLHLQQALHRQHVYRVGGPAASVVGATVVGMLNNCSSGYTPWGTYLTCEEESTDNYIDPDPAKADNGYGWVVEIDPYGTLGAPAKRTAMGRFDHENVAFITDASNNVASTWRRWHPGCIYKFVPSKAFDPNNRAANANLLDTGTLYVAKFNADGSGQWIELTQGNKA
ncbi:conserved protein of unknown function [Cupriavidus taiwanensis]|uniref:PhoX family protein n=1 Tax=Cupriavidus taiwanensis TaxID=164546 RepID=UPI000E10DC54|nr:alkaline phosphatase PhoX [Cupriavidus taiwanensis]SPD38566.1 conserved protein of unknown function [Cupriavidus taiwanensis]